MGREAFGHGGTQPSGCTGHDDDFVLEVHGMSFAILSSMFWLAGIPIGTGPGRNTAPNIT
jgi:hypothetical protein